MKDQARAIITNYIDDNDTQRKNGKTTTFIFSTRSGHNAKKNHPNNKDLVVPVLLFVYVAFWLILRDDIF